MGNNETFLNGAFFGALAGHGYGAVRPASLCSISPSRQHLKSEPQSLILRIVVLYPVQRGLKIGAVLQLRPFGWRKQSG
jgi:hypothetical protein